MERIRISNDGLTADARSVERQGVALRAAVGAADSFQNFGLNLGLGTNNALSSSTYGFNPITRIRTLLDWVHRGSWIGGVAVDVVAEDMTRAGIEITSVQDPEDVDALQQDMIKCGVWTSLCSAIKWGRLYGGALAAVLIDGQDASQPLRIDTVGKGKFRGLLVLDRWMVDPDLQHLVTELGPNLGLPEYYRVVADAPAFRGQRIHYSRCIRLVGIELPYWQRLMENLWGLSVLERLYDRMVAFDSATTGAAQLVYKSFIRVYKMKGLRAAATIGGDAILGIQRQMELTRKYSGIEGISLIDGEDSYDAVASTQFSGISDALIQFGQQLSGALQVPLVRLFGQSPAGLSATGESDLRTYYDGIAQAQKRDLLVGMNIILHVMARSRGIELEKDFGFNFVPLWQMDEEQKSNIADRDVKSVLEVEAAGLISAKTALQELRALSKKTGRYTNVTDEMIDEAEDVPEAPGPDEAEPGQEGEEGEPPRGSLEGLENLKKITRAVGAGGGAGGAGDAAPTGMIIPRIRLADMRAARDRGRDAARDTQIPYTTIGDLQVVVEQRAGTIRRGDGWSVIMPADYGYVRRVGSAEGPQEWLDCFIGPDHSSRDVWVVDSVHPDTGAFDEHKCIFGYRNSRDALDCFRRAYDDQGARRIGGVTHFSMDQLEWKNWLASGDKTQPLAPVAGAAA